jgi:hypothetical protein
LKSRLIRTSKGTPVKSARFIPKVYSWSGTMAMRNHDRQIGQIRDDFNYADEESTAGFWALVLVVGLVVALVGSVIFTQSPARYDTNILSKPGVEKEQPVPALPAPSGEVAR